MIPIQITDGVWMVSAAHPDTGGFVIVNSQGRIVAGMVPSRADADFICAAREAYHMDSITVQVDWRDFGRAIRAARKSRRYSQAVAAQLCGISRTYMASIEAGRATDPSYTIVLTLCRWLGVALPD